LATMPPRRTSRHVRSGVELSCRARRHSSRCIVLMRRHDTALWSASLSSHRRSGATTPILPAFLVGDEPRHLADPEPDCERVDPHEHVRSGVQWAGSERGDLPMQVSGICLTWEREGALYPELLGQPGVPRAGWVLRAVSRSEGNHTESPSFRESRAGDTPVSAARSWAREVCPSVHSWATSSRVHCWGAPGSWRWAGFAAGRAAAGHTKRWQARRHRGGGGVRRGRSRRRPPARSASGPGSPSGRSRCCD
jgi:hypothetical protein